MTFKRIKFCIYR